MGGHDIYLWSSYAAAIVLVLIEFVLLVIRQRAILGHLGWPRGGPLRGGGK